MPQGKGTYGSQVGRPRKKKEEDGSLLNDDRERYAEGEGTKEMTEDMMDVIRRRGEYAPTLDAEFMGFPYSSARKEKALEGVVYGAALLPISMVSKVALAKKALQAYKKIKNVKKTKIKKLEDEYERLENIEIAGLSIGAGTTVVLEDKIPEESLLKKELFKSKTSSKDKSRQQKAEGGQTRKQYQEGTNWLEERLNHAIKSEIKQINQYGDKYWNSGTGLFGPLKRTLGDSGQGLRLYQEMMSINKEMKGQYTPLELFTRANQAFTASGLAEQYRLTESYLPKIKKAEGGEAERPSMEDQMEGLAISVAPVTAIIEEEDQSDLDIEEEFNETEVLPDEQMESNYVDYVIDQTLSDEDKNYLDSALMEDAKLSEIFDQVVESAAEFSGSGPVEGLGTEVSDSIPARLSDGEFVFTAKAADEIGPDQLQRLMKDAESGADRRQGVAYGGVLDKDKKAGIAVSTQGSIAAAGGVPPVVSLDPIREEQLLSMQSSSPRRGYRTISG